MAKYDLTDKHVEFYMESMKDFIRQNPVEEAIKDPEGMMTKNFDFLMDRMLNSSDPDIKLGFSKVLMFGGFQNLVEQTSKAFILGLRDKIFKG